MVFSSPAVLACLFTAGSGEHGREQHVLGSGGRGHGLNRSSSLESTSSEEQTHGGNRDSSRRLSLPILGQKQEQEDKYNKDVAEEDEDVHEAHGGDHADDGADEGANVGQPADEEKPGKDGSQCKNNKGCNTGLFCKGNSFWRARKGRCTPQEVGGHICSKNEECVSATCKGNFMGLISKKGNCAYDASNELPLDNEKLCWLDKECASKWCSGNLKGVSRFKTGKCGPHPPEGAVKKLALATLGSLGLTLPASPHPSEAEEDGEEEQEQEEEELDEEADVGHPEHPAARGFPGEKLIRDQGIRGAQRVGREAEARVRAQTGAGAEAGAEEQEEEQEEEDERK